VSWRRRGAPTRWLLGAGLITLAACATGCEHIHLAFGPDDGSDDDDDRITLRFFSGDDDDDKCRKCDCECCCCDD
jgi:hypothetical protein